MDTIMGQDKSTLLTIRNDMVSGRISFFTVVGIIVLCFILYNMAVIIWSVKKSELLMQYKQELYKRKKQLESGNIDVKKEHAPETEHLRKLNEVRSQPKDQEVIDAIEHLHKFKRRKYL